MDNIGFGATLFCFAIAFATSFVRLEILLTIGTGNRSILNDVIAVVSGWAAGGILLFVTSILINYPPISTWSKVYLALAVATTAITIMASRWSKRHREKYTPPKQPRS